MLDINNSIELRDIIISSVTFGAASGTFAWLINSVKEVKASMADIVKEVKISMTNINTRVSHIEIDVAEIKAIVKLLVDKKI